MPGYLDHYGAGEEQRNRLIKRILISAFAVIVISGGLYLGFRNFRQKSKVKDFIALLQKQDYRAAYAMWGCTDVNPCPDYRFEKFLEDWGPESPNARISSYEISRSRACGSGVIVTLALGPGREERLWVEGPQMTLGYSPWQVCPPR
jgi:hypothetical protein